MKQLFVEVYLSLKIPLSEDQIQKNEIIKQQEEQCNKIYNQFTWKSDDLGRSNAINAGIIDVLHEIISTRNLDDITAPYIHALFVFTHPYSIAISKLLFEKKSLTYLLRLLDHQDQQIINSALAAIVNILYCGVISTNHTLPHPYYEELVLQGGIQKIFTLLQQTTHQFSKNCLATIVGFVFRSREMPDPEMKDQIISHLKSNVNHQDEETRNEVNLALQCLQQNSDFNLQFSDKEQLNNATGQLFIYQFEEDMTESWLKEHFEQFGGVISIFLPVCMGKSRGFGFVTMKEKEASLRAFNHWYLNGFVRLKIIDNQSDYISTKVSKHLSIEDILTSKKTSAEQQISKLQKLEIKFQNESIFKLVVIFDQEQFTAINDKIQNCNSKIELELIKILEIVFERVQQLQLVYTDYNRWRYILFQEIQESKLLLKIETILKQKFEIEEKKLEHEYSTNEQQLICTYLQIQKGHKVEKFILKTCKQILMRNITVFVNKLKNAKNHKHQHKHQHQQKITQGDDDVELDNMMISMTHTLNSVRNSLIYDNCTHNKIQNGRIHDLQDIKFHETFYQLLHFNCPHDLKCTNRIKVRKNNPVFNSLQQAIYDIMGSICHNLFFTQNDLQEKHHMINHIAPIIIKFNKQIILHSQNQYDQQQSLSFSKPSLPAIFVALQFLHDLIIGNDKNNIIVKKPHLINSLIQLSRYNSRNHFNSIYDIQTLQIRINSLKCLRQILIHYNKNVQSQISQKQLLSFLIEIIAQCGGSSNYNVEQLFQAMRCIRFLFTEQHLSNQKTQQEQFEEEGGNEELDSHMKYTIMKQHNLNEFSQDIWRDQNQFPLYITDEFILSTIQARNVFIVLSNFYQKSTRVPIFMLNNVNIQILNHGN